MDSLRQTQQPRLLHSQRVLILVNRFGYSYQMPSK
jgi:hypothetical protein